MVGKRLAKGIIIVVSSSQESEIASLSSSTASLRSPVQSPLLLYLGSVVSMLKPKATFSINFFALPL